MTLSQIKQILISLGAELRVTMNKDVCIAQLSREADKTIVLVADRDLEIAVERAVARFIEHQRRQPTLPDMRVVEVPE